MARTSKLRRTTKETDITMVLNLDGNGDSAALGVSWMELHQPDYVAEKGQLNAGHPSAAALQVVGDPHMAHKAGLGNVIALGSVSPGLRLRGIGRSLHSRAYRLKGRASVPEAR